MQLSISQIKNEDKVIIAYRENDIFAHHCAYICWRYFVKERGYTNVVFMSLTSDDPTPNVFGAYLFLCGISLKEETMIQLSTEFIYCWVFDAFKTSTDDYHKTQYLSERDIHNVTLYLKSDVPMVYPDNQIVRNAWSIFYGGVDIPGILDMVPYTEPNKAHMVQANLINFLRVRRFDFEQTHRYATDLAELHAMIDESDYVSASFSQLCGNVAQSGLQFGELDGILAVVVNAPDAMLEPVINVIVNTRIISSESTRLSAGLVVGYSVSSRHINYTLVSCTNDTDVSVLARKYGGYGNANKAFINRPLDAPIALGSRKNSSMIH
jgi:hypothetical protein